MPTISGTLQSILDDDPNVGSVEVALCGFGSQVPRINGLGLGARVTDDSVDVGDDGGFEFTVTGNDEIVPAGTYYTVTVKNENGDTVQVNAYQFLSATDYDLDATPPFDPSQGPPGIPPFILNLLLTVPFDPNAVFPGNEYTTWGFELKGDCTPSFTNLVPGNLYTIIIEQFASYTFTWPSNVYNATVVRPDPGTFVQTFVASDNGLLPIGPATYYP